MKAADMFLANYNMYQAKAKNKLINNFIKRFFRFEKNWGPTV